MNQVYHNLFEIKRGRCALTKNILKDYQGLLLEEKQLQEQLEIWKAKAVSASGDLDNMPHGSGISDPTSRYAVKITEIKKMLENKHIEIVLELERIEKAIDNLRPQYRYIMREYYINDKTWSQIAVDTNYSIQRVWQMHGEALKNIRAF